MNRIDKLFGMRGEARIRYKHGEFQVLSPGEYVRCAVTAQQIQLGELRYWNVDLQEPYASAEVARKRYIELRQKGQIKV